MWSESPHFNRFLNIDLIFQRSIHITVPSHEMEGGIMKRMLFALLAISLFTSPLRADYKEDLKKGDYKAVLREITPLAQKGDAEAQSILGTMYANGQGVPLNYEKAVAWIRKAAEQGFAEAQYNLGVMHDRGFGVPQNFREAAKWYEKAAEQGTAGAQYNLGLMYVEGQGVQQNYVQAYMWLSLAAVRGDQEAVKARDFITGKMTPAQIAEAQKLVSKWKPKE